MTRPSIIRRCLIVFLVAGSTHLFAQDAHYWSEQFGNKSMLLGGTVNASVEDLGLVFYNPGRLAQIENPAFVISARVYEYVKIHVKDGIGEGQDLQKSSFGGGPNLVAGTFKLPFLKNHRFAYSFLTRHQYNSNFDVRSEPVEDQNVGGAEYSDLSAKLRSNNRLQEEWYGLTWSYAPSQKWSFGLSMFGFQNKSNRGLEIQLQGLRKDMGVSMVNYNRELGFDVFGLVWKAGLAVQLEKINLGLTITTPKLNIRGNGSSVYEDFISGVDSLRGEPVDDVYIENFQNNLDANIKGPWSIGMGIGFKLGKTNVHVSAEWFDKIGKYTMMEAEPFEGQQPQDTIQIRLVDQLRSVFNYGIGIEHKFNEKINAYASIAADYSAVDSDAGFLYEFDDEDIRYSVFDGDIFHFGGGIALNLKWAELTVGATFGAADREITRPLNLGEDVIFDPTETATLEYSRWRFLVGFSFPFANKISQQLEGTN